MPLDVLDEKKQRLRSLKEMLHRYSAPAAEALIKREGNGDVRCFACGHRCLVKPGRDGVCRVRFNEDGQLLVPHGYVGVLACDPIETFIRHNRQPNVLQQYANQSMHPVALQLVDFFQAVL